jgi:hypothetical protein
LRRHRLNKSLVLASFITAAFIPGAAVVTPAGAAGSGCIAVDPQNLAPAIVQADVVVVGTVVSGAQAGVVLLRPEAFLKGAVQNGDLSLTADTGGDCAPATLAAGDRVLALFGDGSGQLRWPGAAQVWLLQGGRATGGSGDSRTEAELIGQIRSLTGQYAVPADSSGGVGITWKGTILPLGGALVVVFVLGLVLMRTWHRIDPT